MAAHWDVMVTTEIPIELLQSRDLNCSAKLLWAALRTFCIDGTQCSPSLTELAETLALPTSSIPRLVRELEQTGWITVKRKGRQANTYRLKLSP